MFSTRSRKLYNSLDPWRTRYIATNKDVYNGVGDILTSPLHATVEF